MTKNVTLVSKDGEHAVEIPEDEAVEITQARAIGWTTKPELKAAERADKQADAK
jgi:hypothetical protein